MKIAIVCPYDISKPGGVAEICLELNARLPRHGHESTLITVKPEHKTNFPRVKTFGQSLEITFNKSSSSISFENLKTDRKIKKYLDDEKFDYICVHEPAAPFLNWEILRHSEATNVSWFHSTSFVDLESFPYNLLLDPLENWLTKCFTGNIAVSSSAAHTWQDYLGKNYQIITGGIDIDRFKKAKKINLGTGVNLLFVGRLDERKGVTHAIRAMPKILSEIPEAKLLVVGDGPDRNLAFDLVAQLKLGGRVQFVGRVPRAELASYYRSADLYLAPSTGGESLGIVLLEAMAAGTPVIAFANSGYKFTLQGSPWPDSLVKVGASAKMAQAAIEILSNNDLRRKVITWQNEHIENFSWDKITNQFLDYLKSLSPHDQSIS